MTVYVGTLAHLPEGDAMIRFQSVEDSAPVTRFSVLNSNLYWSSWVPSGLLSFMIDFKAYPSRKKPITRLILSPIGCQCERKSA